MTAIPEFTAPEFSAPEFFTPESFTPKSFTPKSPTPKSPTPKSPEGDFLRRCVFIGGVCQKSNITPKSPEGDFLCRCVFIAPFRGLGVVFRGGRLSVLLMCVFVNDLFCLICWEIFLVGMVKKKVINILNIVLVF